MASKTFSVALVLSLMLVCSHCWASSYSVYNFCDVNILVRMEITGIIYNDMALDKNEVRFTFVLL